MDLTLNSIEEFKTFLEEFDYFHDSQIDEDSIKLDNYAFEITLAYPLPDTKENNKVYQKFLCFSLEKHAYVNVHLRFTHVKNSEIFLNKDEHGEPLFVNTTRIDEKEKSIFFEFEHEDIKHIQIEYTQFELEVAYNKEDKVFSHKRLKLRF